MFDFIKKIKESIQNSKEESNKKLLIAQENLKQSLIKRNEAVERLKNIDIEIEADRRERREKIERLRKELADLENERGDK